jgi:iron complex outermembrane recepter protein
MAMSAPPTATVSESVTVPVDDRLIQCVRPPRRRRTGIGRWVCAAWLASCMAFGAQGGEIGTPIPAQSLPQALALLAQQTGLQILYVSALADGRRSHRVRAGLPPLEGLTELLDGTGLTFEPINGRAVRLRRAPAAPVSVAPVGTIDDVILVTHSREQSAYRVPASARVVDLADWVPYGPVTAETLLSAIPGLEYGVSSQWGSGFYNSLSMRGVVAEKSGVSSVTYLGDTPLSTALTPNSAFTVPYPLLFDLDRVEVLRGPQGVDYGAGAEGGAIRFVPKRADTITTSADVDAQVGSIDHGGGLVESAVAVADAIVPGLLGLRVAAFDRDEGGYVDHVDPFTDAVLTPNSNRSHRRAARLSLDIEPLPGWSVSPSLSYQRIQTADTPAFYQALSQPALGVFRNGKLLNQPGSDALTVGAVRVEHRGAAVNAVAISSYVHRQAIADIDATNEAGVLFFGGYGSPLGPEVPVSYANAVLQQTGAESHALSQEIRLSSPDAHGPVAWSVGAYVADYRLVESDRYFLAPLPHTAALSALTTDHTTEQNLFGQATVALAPRWRLGAGLRVGRYLRHSTGDDAGYLNGPESRSAHRYAASMPVTPRVELSYEPREGLTLYTSAARGARLGRAVGPSVVCQDVVTPGSSGPDSLWSYEAGFKGSFGNGALLLDASVFDVQWDGVQLRVYDRCGNAFYTTAGTLQSRGMDLHAETRGPGAWRWSLDLGATDAHTTRTVFAPGGVLVALRGATLAGLPDVPAPWIGALSGSYAWSLATAERFVVRSRLVVRSHATGPFPEHDPAFTTYDPRFAADPATVQWNVGIGWERKTLSLDLYVDNLLNEHPLMQTGGDYPGTPLLYALTQRPRTVGLAAHWRL